MRIILAQISISKNYKNNLSKIMDIIDDNVFDIMVFPELALSSYDLKNSIKLSNKKIFKSLESIQKKLGKEQIVIIGTMIKNDKKIYNSAAVIAQNNIVFYNKNTLTKYDSKYFKRGKNILTFKYKNSKIGLLICRDQDNNKLIKQYKREECNILFQLSAHYYNKKTAIKKLDKNIAMPIVRAIDTNTLFCKVNTVGKNKHKISLGSSLIVDSSGCVFRKANMFKEEIIKFNTEEKK